MPELKITQVRSTIGTKHAHRESIRTLGLGKIRKSCMGCHKEHKPK